MAARDRVAAIVIGVLVAALLALAWFCWAVLRQNGRLLQQLDARATAAAPLDLPPLGAGEPAPDFAAATLDGDAVSLSSLLAPSLPVALVFADGHCGACGQVLAEAAKADGDRATVAVVMRGDGAAAREKASALRLPLVIGDPDDAVFGAFRVRGAPGTLLLDPEGRVAKPVQMGVEPGARRAGLRHRGRAGRDRHGGCRMSAATDQLRRIYPALQQSIDQGAFGFADACSATSQAEQSGAPGGAVASPAMATAVATWQGNVNMALDRVNATSPKARGRALALQTWQALATALNAALAGHEHGRRGRWHGHDRAGAGESRELPPVGRPVGEGDAMSVAEPRWLDRLARRAARRNDERGYAPIRVVDGGVSRRTVVRATGAAVALGGVARLLVRPPAARADAFGSFQECVDYNYKLNDYIYDQCTKGPPGGHQGRRRRHQPRRRPRRRRPRRRARRPVSTRSSCRTRLRGSRPSTPSWTAASSYAHDRSKSFADCHG